MLLFALDDDQLSAKALLTRGCPADWQFFFTAHPSNNRYPLCKPKGLTTNLLNLCFCMFSCVFRDD
jgi:hypothetical protein